MRSDSRVTSKAVDLTTVTKEAKDGRKIAVSPHGNMYTFQQIARVPLIISPFVATIYRGAKRISIHELNVITAS